MAEQYIDRESLSKIRANLWRISEAKKITLEDIQDRTKFSYSQVYRILRGANNMSVSGLLKVCWALGVQVKEVINFELTIPEHQPVRRILKKEREDDAQIS